MKNNRRLDQPILRICAGSLATLLWIWQLPIAAQAQPASILPSSPQANELSDHLRTLARNPHDLDALIGAGQSALSAGDGTAALNFFERANEVAPNDGRVKAGLGSTLLLLEDPANALRLFGSAIALGVPQTTIASDRGLAYDLRGDQLSAQRDYRLALTQAAPNDELLRRYALSLGISGQKTEAVATLDLLLRKQDQAAWRDRIFILAMNGDIREANSITRSILPQQADALEPFLKRLSSLTPAQRARAVTYGEMPEDARAVVAIPASIIAPTQLAAVTPAQAYSPTPPVTHYNPAPTPVYKSAPPASKPVAPTPAAPRLTPAPAPVLKPAPAPAPAQIVAPVAPTPKPTPPAAAPIIAVTAQPRFSLNTLLADLKTEPDTPAAHVMSDAELRSVRLTARKKAAEQAKADADAKAKKAEEDAQRAIERKNPAREWVQIAGGNNRKGFARTFATLKDKHKVLFEGRAAYYTPLNHTYRILVGPFSDSSAARDYVNELHKAGLTGFTFSSDAGQEVMRIGGKTSNGDTAPDADAPTKKGRHHHKGDVDETIASDSSAVKKSTRHKHHAR